MHNNWKIKLYRLVRSMLPDVLNPDIVIDTVNDLTEQEIDMLKEHNGIAGAILDVDDTLRHDMQPISIDNDRWLDMLLTKLKVIVVSNGLDREIERYFQSKGIDYIGFAYKPFKSNFFKACQSLGLSPEQMVVIGDDLLADIYGGNRHNMMTIMVTGKKKLLKK